MDSNPVADPKPASAPQPPAGPVEKLRHAVRRLSDLPLRAEVLLWAIVITATIGIRLYLIHLLPMGLWSKDAGSYAYSAFRWVHTGVWETDPRRGPIYSMLIALCGKVWGSIDSLMLLQHFMGATAILLSVFALRLLHGRRALIPLAACGYAYAVYGLPLYLEHLVRNETILFFCASVALVTWLFAIHWRQPHWLWISGLAVAVLSATKNVWLPFPLIFAVATLWYFRKEMRLAITQVLIFTLAFAVPYMGAKVFKHRTLGVDRSDEPQEGVLLYGRTAQFTWLNGGIQPELKKQIRSQVEDYQHEVFGDGTKPPHLNNNEILKKTVVPTLNKILRHEGKTGDDLNNLCEKLAWEAILTHPLPYAQQVWRDIARMHLTGGVRYVAPDDSEPESQRNLLLEVRRKVGRHHRETGRCCRRRLAEEEGKKAHSHGTIRHLPRPAPERLGIRHPASPAHDSVTAAGLFPEPAPHPCMVARCRRPLVFHHRATLHGGPPAGPLFDSCPARHVLHDQQRRHPRVERFRSPATHGKPGIGQ